MKKPLLDLFHLSKDSFRYAPMDCCLLLLFALLRSLTAGVGLLLIIPLLHVTGIPIIGEGNSVLTHNIQSMLLFLHIPLHLLSILLFFILMVSLVATIHLFEALIRSNWGERYQLYLQKTIYQLLLNTKYTFFIKRNNSDLLHSITTQLQASFQCHSLLLQIINQLILIAVYLLLSSSVSWKMTGIASIIAVGLLALMRPLHSLSIQTGRSYLAHNQLLFQSFHEQLCGGLKLIKSTHSESLFISKILALSKAQKKLLHHLTKVQALGKWFYSIGAVIAFSLLLYLAIAVLRLPVDVFILQLIIFSRLLPLISALQQRYQQLLHHLPSYSNLRKLQLDCLAHQEHKEQNDSGALVFKDAIRFENICFSYHFGVLPKVINRFSLQLKKNTTTALIGPSGVGKTTIADLILGLLEPTQGAIYIDEQLLSNQILSSWRKSVAYVPQNAFLFNATVRENLELFVGHQEETHLWAVLKQVAAETFISNLEQGLDTYIGDRGIRLSGGEGQRLAIARALLMRPQLLVLDESTNSLDSQSIQMIQETLLELRGNMTILIISHQTEMSRFADQIIRLNPVKPIPALASMSTS